MSYTCLSQGFYPPFCTGRRVLPSFLYVEDDVASQLRAVHRVGVRNAPPPNQGAQKKKKKIPKRFLTAAEFPSLSPTAPATEAPRRAAGR